MASWAGSKADWNRHGASIQWTLLIGMYEHEEAPCPDDA